MERGAGVNVVEGETRSASVTTAERGQRLDCDTEKVPPDGRQMSAVEVYTRHGHPEMETLWVATGWIEPAKFQPKTFIVLCEHDTAIPRMRLDRAQSDTNNLGWRKIVCDEVPAVVQDDGEGPYEPEHWTRHTYRFQERPTHPIEMKWVEDQQDFVQVRTEARHAGSGDEASVPAPSAGRDTRGLHETGGSAIRRAPTAGTNDEEEILGDEPEPRVTAMARPDPDRTRCRRHASLHE